MAARKVRLGKLRNWFPPLWGGPRSRRRSSAAVAHTDTDTTTLGRDASAVSIDRGVLRSWPPRSNLRDSPDDRTFRGVRCDAVRKRTKNFRCVRLCVFAIDDRSLVVVVVPRCISLRSPRDIPERSNNRLIFITSSCVHCSRFAAS